MRRSALVIALPLAAAVLFAGGCGDGPDKPPSTATTAPTSATGSAPTIPADFGTPPRLGGNITAIVPAHASKVPAAELKVTTVDRIGGICFVGNFDGFDKGNLQWFRMVIDSQEVTEHLVWFVTSAQTSGTACYQTKEGLPVGKHTAAVSVQNPSSPNEPTRQVVGWAFEVTP